MCLQETFKALESLWERLDLRKRLTPRCVEVMESMFAIILHEQEHLQQQAAEQVANGASTTNGVTGAHAGAGVALEQPPLGPQAAAAQRQPAVDPNVLQNVHSSFFH